MRQQPTGLTEITEIISSKRASGHGHVARGVSMLVVIVAVSEAQCSAVGGWLARVLVQVRSKKHATVQLSICSSNPPCTLLIPRSKSLLRYDLHFLPYPNPPLSSSKAKQYGDSSTQINPLVSI